MAFIKASHLQANIDSIEQLPPEAAVEVKRRAAATIAEASALSRSHWAPFELDLALCTAVHDVVGTAGVRRLNVEAMRRSGEAPLLRPIRDAGRRLGVRPDALLRFAQHGWSAMFKDVGVAAWIADGARGGTIELSDVPRDALTSQAWVEACAGGVEGVIALMGCAGTVSAVTDLDARTLRLVARW